MAQLLGRNTFPVYAAEYPSLFFLARAPGSGLSLVGRYGLCFTDSLASGGTFVLLINAVLLSLLILMPFLPPPLQRILEQLHQSGKYRMEWPKPFERRHMLMPGSA
jgi:hypothetical protein